ncbi:CDC9 ATP-dependent DNA ligase [uncultured Caudovirales phage]|uniref:DNA ligase n=1 Tax=uncultured Caudovirales phage TaxID=2100421 RepID=A0A6J5PA23_9CAUD|nr:CDC9 ATP-dependent DNA ligase [uncultured Caudovirales phage]CAB4168037.1 CDC9 ATP-dependent DNA ligase [uncultured Caudovirales phage]CAB4174900.1 CDC9 ATP-dependent DNA ligase [uncultured Caudovirales phage]CAB4180710.1 CDC9 ATP-dependent DNA ligase [uncultured Caudovirales phage]CAB4186314.1 CDC9 ATP-dependent DNA ligase [uncultured Caudovirales phage]
MIREIESKRDTVTGRLQHTCPLNMEKITTEVCTLCPKLDSIKTNSASYTVFCTAKTNASLFMFDPAKSSDRWRTLSGKDLLSSHYHTVMQPKIDGCRVIIYSSLNGAVITTRNKDKTGLYSQIQDKIPHIRDSVLGTMPSGYVFDGEVVAGTLRETMSIVNSSVSNAVKLQSSFLAPRMKLIVFDILRHDSTEITLLPETKRFALLSKTFADNSLEDEDVSIIRRTRFDRKSESYLEDRKSLYDSYLKEGYEGAMLKDPRCHYYASSAWVKIKQTFSVDGIVVGWKKGKIGTKYENSLGTLVVSVIDEKTKELREICHVSPGTDAMRLHMKKTLELHEPEQISSLGIIVEITGQEWSDTGKVRHPRVSRLRTDKSEPNTVDFSSKTVVS